MCCPLSLVSHNHQQQRIGDEQQMVKKNKEMMNDNNKKYETKKSTQDSYIKATKKVDACVVGPLLHEN